MLVRLRFVHVNVDSDVELILRHTLEHVHVFVLFGLINFVLVTILTRDIILGLRPVDGHELGVLDSSLAEIVLDNLPRLDRRRQCLLAEVSEGQRLQLLLDARLSD